MWMTSGRTRNSKSDFRMFAEVQRLEFRKNPAMPNLFYFRAVPHFRKGCFELLKFQAPLDEKSESQAKEALAITSGSAPGVVALSSGCPSGIA
jgi:hypothetical protein